MTAKELQAAFRRQQYLQVLTLVIPADAYPLLQAFPQVTELVVNRFSSKHGYAPHIALLDTYNLHEAIATYCHCLKLLSTDTLTLNYIEHMQLVYGVFSLDRIQSSPISNLRSICHNLDTSVYRAICSIAQPEYHDCLRVRPWIPQQKQ